MGISLLSQCLSVGSVQNMERYRFLIGRLEALTMVEELVKKEIKQWQAEDF